MVVRVSKQLLTRPVSSAIHDVSVCALVREPPEVIVPFVRYYLDLGVRSIFLFFDEPTDPTQYLFLGDPRVRPIACDGAFWGKDGRPDGIERRQRRCYTAAYAAVSSGWLLVCDGDEYLWFPGGLQALLEHVPSEQAVIRADTVEAVWGPGQQANQPFSANLARRYTPGRGTQLAELVYGAMAPLFTRGILSHTVGKYVMRAGLPVQMLKVHGPLFDATTNGTGPQVSDAIRATLVHFDAMSFPFWRRKMSHRVASLRSFGGMSGARRAQVERFEDAGSDPKAQRRLFRQLYGVSEPQIAALDKRDLLVDLRLFDLDAMGGGLAPREAAAV